MGTRLHQAGSMGRMESTGVLRGKGGHTRVQSVSQSASGPVYSLAQITKLDMFTKQSLCLPHSVPILPDVGV